MRAPISGRGAEGQAAGIYIFLEFCFGNLLPHFRGRRQKKAAASLHGARKRVPTKSGKLQGGRAIRRSINHSRFYLPLYLIARLPRPPIRTSVFSFSPRPYPRFLRFSNSSDARVFCTPPRVSFDWPSRDFPPVEGVFSLCPRIHRSAMHERVPWQRENSNDRAA